MSRLYDRVLANGCEPLTVRHIIESIGGPDEAIHGETGHPYRAAMRSAFSDAHGREPTDDEVADGIRTSLSRMAERRSSDHFEPQELEGAVVVSAEEVADYWATLPGGTDMIDVLDCLAPLSSACLWSSSIALTQSG
jgi:hypothetical protein